MKYLNQIFRCGGRRDAPGLTRSRLLAAGAVILLLLFVALPLYAASKHAPAEDYRTFFGLDSRITVWVIAELHLMFGAFVLGVPIFAVVIEAIGWKTKEKRYDRLAYEFTKLLSAAFATTAALGGLLAFSLFGLYPTFMAYLTNVFHDWMYFYAFLFFGETFSLYFYFYLWDQLQDRKGLHIFFGVLLNIFGTLIMMVANSWATFMMSPVGIDKATGQFAGTDWQALVNPLWLPLVLHRTLGNIAFGGFICGAYAAVRFMGASTPEEKAHYDWMGYVGNFVAVCGLIPLPFAGYFLGREVYSNSAVMGNNMMGGEFSWTFILQAVLVGTLFIGSNYYLWAGMPRIPGSDRYVKYIKYINAILLICFAVWLTPHNLPLSAEEQITVGGQYHPTLKFLGLMAGKNAVINLMILSTFFTFLLYRRANKVDAVSISRQGNTPRIWLIAVGAICTLWLAWYGSYTYGLNPAALDLAADKAFYLKFVGAVLFIEIAAVWICVVLALTDKGKVAQFLYLGLTITLAVFILGPYGYIVMAVANPVLRNISFSQWSMLMTCLFLVSTIDVFLFKGAKEVGRMAWGKVPDRSQYALIAICVAIVLNIGLMGFIRSGLRDDWHIYGVLRDTSPDAFTPTNATMAWVVSLCLVIFLGTVSVLFWMTDLGEKKTMGAAEEPGAPKEMAARGLAKKKV
jgi:cytochrome bd ubiquinol oxidase subunit I